MSVLLQISDAHFGTEQASVVEALVALSQQQRPDVLVLSGDITQRARASEFHAARALVNRLGKPVLAIPGNHDIPLFNLGSRLLHPYARHCEAFGDELEPVHTSPELLVLCINTTRWYRHKNGEVSPAQIERVSKRLASAEPGQLRVVVVHHPVAVLRAVDVQNLLRGHAAALQLWAAAGADLVLGGHIHLPYVIALPDLARPMWAVQAGTAVSSRVRDGVPNSVNLLRWGSDAPAGRCLIERWDYTAASQAFVRTAVTDVQPARTGTPADVD
ncbi:metallophosphoesterase family protein [Rhodoferax fermentans]|uniref:DNA repair exonuclease n=1 Tax=Rhodoferax fermentans TaxID=28066 RepID=A0A1T1AWR2_RHOFE|nr:metallophosphoesterase [Rhodoferax fermentans]MBK1685662.1 DNA repair exonuclease [Rhodoferax fermentans]OOV08398.1 DNA repair exonuclease [Rhodoferax fermentans]